MEFIVQLFRTMANRHRIRIVRLLAVFHEMCVTDISDATKLRLTAISGHLKALAAAGLVWRRRSARKVSYRLAEHAGNPVTAGAIGTLQEIFRLVPPNSPKKVARADHSDSSTTSDAALFACFTAFTHPRRLQIIRHLAREREATLSELTSSLSMSERACLRHLAKLKRRGFMSANRKEDQITYALTSGEGAAQQRLLKAVQDYLRAPKA